jgi:hypothetical protein
LTTTCATKRRTLMIIPSPSAGAGPPVVDLPRT